MNKKGLTAYYEYDFAQVLTVKIEKKRGKLTLNEIEETLRQADRGQWRGNYVILLRCGEATIEGDGFYDETPVGDSVLLYPVDDNKCPVCQNFMPPYEYCPECGTAWNDEGENAARRATVENWLRAIREQAENCINSRDPSTASWYALYWQYIGAVKMARELNLIDDDTLAKLITEGEKIKPLGVET